MDDPRILRVITVGLILAILAVVYFMLTGGFAVSKSKTAQNQTNQVNRVVESPKPTSIAAVTNPQQTPIKSEQAATPSANSTPSNKSHNVQTLPRTGFPVGLAVVFSASAVVSGLSLRKFPK